MAEKKAFVLRINPEIIKQLEKWAADDFRSVNGQIEFLLQKALARKWKDEEGEMKRNEVE
ncbi:MAG: Arc family DNA binding domain-containing protein [Bacteroidetes bacterium]|nr:Arc family DNA binding domain-containing protein [Bacteroidota bacterium]